MQETLMALDLPPGFVNTGTTYQAKNRWFTGSLVRFFQKTIQPVGGWVQRTTTGATIAGTPTAALAWQTNDGASWLAIGTTTKLYVVSSANVVSDITPTASYTPGSNPVYWQLDTFGSYLVATFNGGANTADMNVYAWAGDPSTFAVPVVSTAFDGPYLTYGLVTTPERFLVVLRGSDPATLGGGAPRAYRASRSGATASQMID